MPDRGKERDSTDGTVLPSSLLLRGEQAAGTNGCPGTAPAPPRGLTLELGLSCSRAGPVAPGWGGVNSFFKYFYFIFWFLGL